MTPVGQRLAVDASLLRRFLAAEKTLQWTGATVATTSGGRMRAAKDQPHTRLAYLHDETARVESRSSRTETRVTVTSGPVGALVMIGELSRRGLPVELTPRPAGELPGFPEGAIEARWDPRARRSRRVLPVGDVIDLARYALA